MSGWIIAAIVAALALLLWWLFMRQDAAPNGAGTWRDTLTPACDATAPIPHPAGTVRATFRVVRDCGNGVRVLHETGGRQHDYLPGPEEEPRPNPIGFTGRGVIFGELHQPLHVHCLPGSGGCEIVAETAPVVRSSTNSIYNELVESRCGKVAFAARFNGLRRDMYEAEIRVEQACSGGVRIKRYYHQARGVTRDGGAETVEGQHFDVQPGHSARWQVKSSRDNGNVWFHVECLGDSGQCKFRIEITDPTF